MPAIFLKEGNVTLVLLVFHIRHFPCDKSIFFMIQELSDILEAGVKHFCNIQVDEANILCWQGLIVPVSTKLALTKQ